MAAIKRYINKVIPFAIFLAFYFAFDWVRPFLEKSPFFHGVFVFVGFITLPFWFLIDRIDNRSPFSSDAFFLRYLLLLNLVSISFGMVLYGLGFWFKFLLFASYLFLGLFLMTFIIGGVMVYQKEKEHRKQ